VTPPTLVTYHPAELAEGTAIAQDTPIDLELSIDEQGRVTEAVALGTSDSILREAAIAAALRFVFTPARRDDEPISVKVAYRFWLAKTPPPETRQEPGQTPSETPQAAPPSAPSRSGNKPEQAKPEATQAAPGSATGSAPRNEAVLEGDEIYEAIAEVKAPAREATRRSLDERQLTKVAGTRGDPIRAIELLPGVARTGGGNAPVLRGAAESESVVLLDGTYVPLLYHFGGLTSFVHPRLIESVDLYPGNFSSRYGRATGGIVEAHLRSPKKELGGVLDVNLLDSSLLVEGPLTDKLGAAAAFRRSNIDFVFESFVPDGAFNVVTAPVYWDYQAIVQHDISRDSFLRLAAFGSRDELTLVFDEPNREDANLRGSFGAGLEFHRLQALHQTRFGAILQRVHLTLGTQFLDQNFGPSVQAFFNLYEFDSRGEWTFSLTRNAQLIAGFDVAGQRLVGAYKGSVASAQEGSLDIDDSARDQVTVDETTIDIVSPAAYVEARIHPTERLLLIPGIRFDYYHQLRESTVNPRLSQRWTLTDSTVLKSGIGWYSQPPLYYEAFAPMGNPELSPYHSLHTSAGVEQRLHETLEVDVEGFYKRVTNRVVGTEGGAPPQFINDGDGRILGVEFGAAYSPNEHGFAQLAYTLSRSERRDRDSGWRLFDQDQTHVLSLAAGYELGAGWEVGARYRHVTGNPTTPITGSVFDAARGSYVPTFGAQNSVRDAAFNQLDVRVEKAFRIGSGLLAITADVQNVTNAQNPEGYTYSYDYQAREPATSTPFFPNLGLRGEL
jgi:hypothetical protein